MKKEYSELIVDINQSIAEAYNTSLSQKKRDQVKAHLACILPKLSEPNTLIAPIKDALHFISHQEAKTLSWKDWLVKPVLVALVTAILTAPVAFYVGMAIEKSKASDCEAQ